MIDGGKDSIIDTININKYGGFMNFGGIGAICGNETTNKIYVCEMYVGNNNILVIDGATNEIVDTLVASGSICVNTITNKIYAGGTNISIINGINDSIIAVVPTGNYITGICVNPTINRIYAVSQYDSTLSVIDGIGDSLIQKISLGRKPTRIAVNPQTNIIYVSCSDAGEVLVLKDNTGVEEKSSPPGRDVATLQISKNPFIKSTVISYSIPATSKVSLALYDVSGRCAKTLVNGEKEAGRYTINLNAKDLKTGVYFVRLTAGHYKEIKKLILMR
ncbi:MAG: T9SS type A sorting domain-containing protein [bacterium]